MQACAFREASYRFSDSLCILNPAAEKRKTDRQKDRGKKWETEGKKKKASCCFIHHSFQKHSNQHQLGRRNPIRIMLSLSIPACTVLCRAAQPRDSLFMSLEQHHMRRVPHCAPRGPAPWAGDSHHSHTKPNQGSTANLHKKISFQNSAHVPNILQRTERFYAVNISAHIS